MKRFAVYLMAIALVWRWYKTAQWRNVPEDKWIKKANEGGYPLEPLT
jgi:hypothetical protein